MKRVSAAINLGLEVVAMILLAILCAVTFLGVLDRYLLQTGIGWTEELARFLLIWASLVSAAVVVYRGAHFCVAVLVDLLPTGPRRAISILMNLLAIGVLAVVFVQGVRVADIMRIQTSPAMDLPMNWIYLSLPVATGVMILFLVAQTLEMVRPGGKSGRSA